MLKRFCLPVFICIITILNSCKPEGGKTSSGTAIQSTDAKDETVNLRVSRFEKDLFAIPFDSVAERLPALKRKYGPFLDIFASRRVINIGKTSDPEFPKYLKSFITDRYMFLTYKKVMEVYPNFESQTQEIEDAFQKYHEIFPQKAIPHVFTLISGYNKSFITADTILGISLDKYLGQNCEYYDNLGLPFYQRRLMTKEYLPTDALRGWCYSEFLYNDSAENVLTNLLYEGKIIYLMKELFPEKNDTIIFGYSAKHMEWVKQNIEPMWTFLIERKLVFSTDYMTINKLISPAPFTALFNSESPGRAAVYVGYRIIDSYMRNNKVSIPQLLADENYQRILENSKFQAK
jgi:hypothetical protein